MFILVWCVLFVGSAPAQTRPTATPSPEAKLDATREDRELTEARRRNEDAQATYYQKQTEKLNQPAPAKSFWRTLSDNAAILGALTAALVALFTLIVNQRTALRARRDTEFYEALKRFGDPVSATVRASAAGMLARISETSFVNFPRRRSDRRWRDLRKIWWQKPWEWIKKRTVSYPYFDTTLDQLVTGLSIEEHAVVVAAITDALARLIPFNRDRAATQLYIANRRLQIQLVEQLAWVVALFADHDDWKESEQVWELACSYTGYARQALEDLPDLHAVEFKVARQEASLTVRKSNADSRRDIEDTARHQLTAIGSRLRQSVGLLVQPFDKERADSVLDLHGAFLANAQFPLHSNLRSVELGRAVLCGANLYFPKLTGASLVFARLEGVVLVQADLEGTRLLGARIDAATNLRSSNWWKADFITITKGVTTEVSFSRELLEDIIAGAGEPTAGQLRDAHPAVREYFESLPRSASEVNKKQDSES